MRSQRLFTLGLDNEPHWLHLFINQMDEIWAAMMVADGAIPPAPGEFTGTGFIAVTAEEAERLAKAYLGESEPKN
jgi:hypothetical protein